MIRGSTLLLAHLGFPTETFKAPLIYNPYFWKRKIDAVVVPMGVKAEDYRAFLPTLFRLSNIRGALVTMPHKVTTVELLDQCSTAVRVAGSCNAILKRPDGTLLGDLFDGEGFVRGLLRKKFRVEGCSCLVVGAGGVGSAIAASLAQAGVKSMVLCDAFRASADGLAARLNKYFPQLVARVGGNDPTGFDLVVNASPLGMKPDDPLPIDVTRLAPSTFVGEVVMKEQFTPLLQAARAKGCPIQVGTDMLFEQIPAYLEFFGLPTTTPEELRAVATLG